MKPRTVVFPVDGGLGKNIMGSVVVRNIRKQYPEAALVVIAGYPNVFQYNPHVQRTIMFQDARYVYEDYIKPGKALVLRQEPYIHPEYLARHWHLTRAWCDAVGVGFDNVVPEVHTLVQDEQAAQMLFATQNLRPEQCVLVQWVGGPVPESTPEDRQAKRLGMQRRALRYARVQELLTAIRDAGYTPLVVQHQNHPQFEETMHINPALRTLACMVPHVKHIICIDSFLQHLAAAKQKQATVLWGGTSPKVLGYDLHTNLTRPEPCDDPHCHRPNSFLFDSVAGGQPWTCPFNDACMDFTVDEIMETLK
jgi:hypothetical protein